VFSLPDAITVTGFDRSRPGVPAKDLTAFVAATHAAARRRRLEVERANGAAAVFLEEYFAHVPEAETSWLYHWSSHLVLSLFRAMKRLPNDDADGGPVVHFHLREIRRVMETPA
jgi:hypothetical protein